MKEGVCIHFNGPIHNKKCAAGVEYRAIVGGKDPGWLIRTPCIKKHGISVCDLYKEPTPEEVLADKDAFERSFNGTQNAIAAIIEKTNAQPEFAHGMSDKKQGHSGKIDCPLCGGTLNYVVSSGNHHVRGRCETPSCLSWMM